jgi:hypothetical protein
MGSTTEIDNSSRLENVLAMLESAWGHPPRPGGAQGAEKRYTGG